MDRCWGSRLLGGAILFALAAACGGSVGEDKSTNGSAGSAAGPDAGAGAGGSAGVGVGGSVGGSVGASGSAGVSGSAGAAGSTGAGSGGSAGSSECYLGGPCVDGSSCREPVCCGCSLRCMNGQWYPETCASCTAPTCPKSVPQAGATCDPCTDVFGEACAYHSCPNGTETRATCENNVWVLDIKRCPNSPCGDQPGAAPCPSGQVCVSQGGWVPQYSCVEDPCAPNPLSCDCAGSLCTVGHCSKAANRHVECVCPVC